MLDTTVKVDRSTKWEIHSIKRAMAGVRPRSKLTGFGFTARARKRPRFGPPLELSFEVSLWPAGVR